MELITTGRVDFEDYFRLSGIREFRELNMYPFVIFEPDLKHDEMRVTIVNSAKKLLLYPPETKVMAQMGGRHKSDFFQFTVQNFLDFIKGNPKKGFELV